MSSQGVDTGHGPAFAVGNWLAGATARHCDVIEDNSTAEFFNQAFGTIAKCQSNEDNALDVDTFYKIGATTLKSSNEATVSAKVGLQDYSETYTFEVTRQNNNWLVSGISK